jgi:DNA-directed RNA polymerase subunit F
MSSIFSNPVVDVALGGATYLSVLAVVLTFLYRKYLKEHVGELAKRVEARYSTVGEAVEILEESYGQVKEILADEQVSQEELASFVEVISKIRAKIKK